MRRVVLVVAALALLSPISAAALQAGPGVAQTGGNATANASADVAPGARLAGVVGSQGARIDGEVEQRSFAVRLERANSTGARAATVAAVVHQTNDTVGELRAQLKELRAAREAGNVTESTYRARVAIIAQRIDAARALANRSSEAAADLPDAALREHGVSHAEVRALSERAAKLGGPEVAAIARNLTGRSDARRAGPPAGVGPSNQTRGDGPPEDGIGKENATPGGSGNDAAGGAPGERGANASAGKNGSAGVGSNDATNSSGAADGGADRQRASANATAGTSETNRTRSA